VSDTAFMPLQAALHTGSWRFVTDYQGEHTQAERGEKGERKKELNGLKSSVRNKSNVLL
jgi:hypothetical protein